MPTILLPSSTNNAPTVLVSHHLDRIIDRVAGTDRTYLMTLLIDDVTNCCHDDASTHNLPDHLSGHLLTMARLHAANRYDRLTHDVEAIIGGPATSIRDFVARHREFFDKHAAVA
jgi:hypothetical protein